MKNNIQLRIGQLAEGPTLQNIDRADHQSSLTYQLLADVLEGYATDSSADANELDQALLARLDMFRWGRVLYAARSGKESLADLEAFTQRTPECLEQEGQTPVHLIWDMTDLDVADVDRQAAMIHLNQLMKHKKVKWFVVVDRDMSSLRRFFAETFLRLNGIHWRTVESQSAGLAFLRKSDASLGLEQRS